MKTTKLFFCILCAFFLALPSFSLRIEKYSFLLGGSASLPITYERPAKWSVDLDIAPRAGFFVLENFEVYSKINFAQRLKSQDNDRNFEPHLSWGILAGVNYYFGQLKHLMPYVGIGAGFSMTNVELLSSRIDLEIPLGILVPLSETVFLDIASPIRIQTSIRALAEIFKITPGYFGIKAVF